MRNESVMISKKHSNPFFSHSSSKTLAVIFILLIQPHLKKIKTKNIIILCFLYLKLYCFLPFEYLLFFLLLFLLFFLI